MRVTQILLIAVIMTLGIYADDQCFPKGHRCSTDHYASDYVPCCGDLGDDGNMICMKPFLQLGFDTCQTCAPENSECTMRTDCCTNCCSNGKCVPNWDTCNWDEGFAEVVMIFGGMLLGAIALIGGIIYWIWKQCNKDKKKSKTDKNLKFVGDEDPMIYSANNMD